MPWPSGEQSGKFKTPVGRAQATSGKSWALLVDLSLSFQYFSPLEHRDLRADQQHPQGRDRRILQGNPMAGEAEEEKHWLNVLLNALPSISSHLVQTISNEEVLLSNQCSWSKLPQLLDRIVRVCNVPVKNFDMFLLGFLLCSHKFSFNWERIVLHFETSCWPQSGFLHFLLSVGFPRVTGVIGGICVKYLTNICVLELNNWILIANSRPSHSKTLDSHLPLACLASQGETPFPFLWLKICFWKPAFTTSLNTMYS